LNTLQRFAKEYIVANVAEKRPDRAANQKEAINRIHDPLLEQYNKVRPNGSGLRRCSFFDPTVPNGGPRPVDETSKRSTAKWYHDILCVEFDEGCKRRRRSTEFDPFDEYEERYEQRGVADISIRLANDPALALRQVIY